MSYELYKVLHLVGIVLLFSGLVSVLTIKLSGAALEGKQKKFAFMTHGIGLLLILISGFGLMARLGLVQEFPKWIFIKLSIWLFMGLVLALIKRKAQDHAFKLYTILLSVFMVAAYVAITKPFSL